MEASEALLMVVITLINPWYQLGCLVGLGGVVNKKKVAYIAGCCCL